MRCGGCTTKQPDMRCDTNPQRICGWLVISTNLHDVERCRALGHLAQKHLHAGHQVSAGLHTCHPLQRRSKGARMKTERHVQVKHNKTKSKTHKTCAACTPSEHQAKTMRCNETDTHTPCQHSLDITPHHHATPRHTAHASMPCPLPHRSSRKLVRFAISTGSSRSCRCPLMSSTATLGHVRSSTASPGAVN